MVREVREYTHAVARVLGWKGAPLKNVGGSMWKREAFDATGLHIVARECCGEQNSCVSMSGRGRMRRDPAAWQKSLALDPEAEEERDERRVREVEAQALVLSCLARANFVYSPALKHMPRVGVELLDELVRDERVGRGDGFPHIPQAAA